MGKSIPISILVPRVPGTDPDPSGPAGTEPEQKLSVGLGESCSGLGGPLPTNVAKSGAAESEHSGEDGESEVSEGETLLRNFV